MRPARKAMRRSRAPARRCLPSGRQLGGDHSRVLDIASARDESVAGEPADLPCHRRQPDAVLRGEIGHPARATLQRTHDEHLLCRDGLAGTRATEHEHDVAELPVESLGEHARIGHDLSSFQASRASFSWANYGVWASPHAPSSPARRYHRPRPFAGAPWLGCAHGPGDLAGVADPGPHRPAARRRMDLKARPDLGRGSDHRAQPPRGHGLLHAPRPGRQRLGPCRVPAYGLRRGRPRGRRRRARGRSRQARLLHQPWLVRAVRPGDQAGRRRRAAGAAGAAEAAPRRRGRVQRRTQTAAAVPAGHDRADLRPRFRRRARCPRQRAPPLARRPLQGREHRRPGHLCGGRGHRRVAPARRRPATSK